jgi:hypothetical protein
VNLFYSFFIPAVLGGMGLLVFMNVSRDVLDRRKRLRAAGAQIFDDAQHTAPQPPLDAGDSEPGPQTPSADSDDSEAQNG